MLFWGPGIGPEPEAGTDGGLEETLSHTHRLGAHHSQGQAVHVCVRGHKFTAISRPLLFAFSNRPLEEHCWPSGPACRQPCAVKSSIWELLECLSTMHEALDRSPPPQTLSVVRTCNLILGKRRQEDHEFSVTVDYTVSLMPALACETLSPKEVIFGGSLILGLLPGKLQDVSSSLFPKAQVSLQKGQFPFYCSQSQASADE